MAKESRAKSAMGGGKKSGGKKAKHKAHKVHIHRGASGGFVVHHEQEPDADDMGAMPQQGDPHVVNDMAGLQAHLQEHMGDQPPAQAPAPAAAAAAPGSAVM